MYKLFNDDCLNIKLSDIDCIYLDPPYSCKDGNEDVYYGVEGDFDNFLKYMEERIVNLKSCMNKDGSNFLIHMDYKAIHYIKVLCDKIFGRDNFRNEIIWCFSGPSVSKSRLPCKHNNILWYGIGKYAYNALRVPYTSKLNVGGKTAWKEKTDVQEYLDKGKLIEDFWIDIPALQRNEKEKLGYETQKPMKLMSRIVSMFSNENQNIYDPFCGSGSFLDAACALKRNAFGSDISDKACGIAEKRLEKYRDNSASIIDASSRSSQSNG